MKTTQISFQSTVTLEDLHDEFLLELCDNLTRKKYQIERDIIDVREEITRRKL
jgi:hypothetical protein